MTAADLAGHLGIIIPSCPCCRGDMVLRIVKSKRGPFPAGTLFWDCSFFPYCYGTVDFKLSAEKSAEKSKTSPHKKIKASYVPVKSNTYNPPKRKPTQTEPRWLDWWDWDYDSVNPDGYEY